MKNYSDFAIKDLVKAMYIALTPESVVSGDYICFSCARRGNSRYSIDHAPECCAKIAKEFIETCEF